MGITVSIHKRLSPSFSLNIEFTAGTDSTGEIAGNGCLGILGASGCGKSMTLKCIAGIETPDTGHIEVNGRVLFDSAKGINLKPQQRRVGYLFQHYALFPRMTVLQNICVGLPLSKAEAHKMAHNYIERFELAGLENRLPHQLSGGQQQRAALARMLIREPELVLLDEPFSALDTNLREQMQLQFLELIKSRQNVILVTHNRDEVFKLCGETLLVEAGRALARDKTAALFQNPGTVQAARLTGCKNISAVKRTGEREVYALDWGLTLRSAAEVGQDISHVGIRAHDFRPSQNETYNLISPQIKTSADEPFERIVVFTNAAACAPREHGELWWKYSRQLNLAGAPDLGSHTFGEAGGIRLFIPPEALLLLRQPAGERKI